MQLITYTFPADCPLLELRGVTISGGKPETMVIDKKPVEVVRFPEKVAGKEVVARTSGRSDLEAAVAAYRAEESAERQAAKDVLEAAVPRVHELVELANAVVDDHERYSDDFEKMMENEQNDGAMPPRTVNSALAERLRDMLRDYPRAALYLRAKRQSESAGWADNAGRGAAGSSAMKILASGGSIEAATTELDARRAFTD